MAKIALAQTEPDLYYGMAEAGGTSETQLGGQWMTAKDTVHVLVVFVQFPDDNYEPQYSLWQKDEAPTFMNTYIGGRPEVCKN